MAQGRQISRARLVHRVRDALARGDVLITAYAQTGRTGHALRQYLECRRALVSELGVEPAEETSRLQARVLAGEPV